MNDVENLPILLDWTLRPDRSIDGTLYGSNGKSKRWRTSKLVAIACGPCIETETGSRYLLKGGRIGLLDALSSCGIDVNFAFE